MVTGIDKLWLNTQNFEVKEVKSSNFGIDQTIKQGNNNDELPYLFTDQQGKDIRANKIYHNPMGKGVAHYTIERKFGKLGLMVQFNPSKLMHPYNLVELNSSGYNEALLQVQTEMSTLGIQADLSNMSVNRLDIAKQSEMNYPFYQYEDAFRLMKGVRSKKKSYEGSYYFSNQSTEVSFYDKVQEMKFNKLDANLCDEKNFMRSEIRALKHPSVARLMKIGTLRNLSDVSPSDLDIIYNNYISSKVFGKSKEPIQTTLNIDAEVDIMKYYLSTGRGGVWKYFLSGGLDFNILKLGGIDNCGRLLSEAGMERTWVYRTKVKIQEMIIEKSKIDALRKHITPAILIEELKQKFAA